LAVGCLNFVNLMTARSMGRAREIGVRKSIGATSARIVAQDLFQTGLIVLLGMVLALLFLAAAVHITQNRWRVLVEVPWSRPVLWGLLGAVLVGVTLAAGAYPAAVLARIRPASALRLGTSRSGPRALRAVLVVAQVAAAAFLVVVVLVVLGQADTMRTAMLGRFADPYVVAILPPSTLRQAGLDVITDEIGRGSGVTGVTASATYPFQLANQGGARLSRAPVDQTMPTRYEMVMVAFDYFSVMQIPVIAGRGYSRDYSDPPSPTTAEEWAALKGPTRVVVDRRAARSLGWTNPADAIGQAVYTSAPRPSEIIGVVESVPLSLRTRDSDGVVYFLDRNFTQVVITRVAAAQTDVALEHLERVWKRFVPEAAIERLFLDEAFETQYRFYRFAQYVLATLAVVAVSIAAIGLFGMAAYVTRRRTREVGLRKSQGASPRRILGMLLFDFTKPVLLGNLLAWPFAFVVARGYVDLFSARMQLTPIPFVLALLGSLLVAWIAVGGFVWRAARLNPTVALREE
jgi:putative ABC transport system permease protein